MRAAKAAAKQQEAEAGAGAGGDGEEEGGDFDSRMRSKMQAKRRAMGIEQPAAAAGREQQKEQQQQRQQQDGEPELDYGESGEDEEGAAAAGSGEEDKEEGAFVRLLPLVLQSQLFYADAWTSRSHVVFEHCEAPCSLPSALLQPPASARAWPTRGAARSRLQLWWCPAGRSRLPTRSCSQTGSASGRWVGLGILSSS
jgi:hypothetical protein